MTVEFAYSKSIGDMSYDAALMYCFFLEYNGHNDWRLPTFDEVKHQLEVGQIYKSTHWMWCLELSPDRINEIEFRGNIRYSNSEFEIDYDPMKTALVALPCRTITEE